MVAVSACKAEYIALTETCRNAAWLRRLVADVLHLSCDPAVFVECDFDGTILSTREEFVTRRKRHTDSSFNLPET